MNFTTEHIVPLYDLANDPDIASNMTLNYTEVVWNVSTTVMVGTTFIAEELERVAEVIAHYHAVARTIWRIWPPIALVFGTLGNVLSGIVMTRKALRASTTSFLLTVLAVVDTLVLWTDLMRQWLRYGYDVDMRTFSRTACKMHKFFIFWNGTCAAWMIILLSLERFVSIYLPITSRTWTTRRKVIVILLAVAALLCGVNLHHLWTYDLRQRSYGMSCTTVAKYKLFLSEYWPWLNFATYSIVPLSVMIVTSIAIIARIVHSQAQRNKTLNKKDGDTAKTTSITLTLLCVCLMFVLTNGPITVDRVIQDNFVHKNYTPEESARRRVTWALLVNINLLNNSCNFILYVLLAPSFRKQLVLLFSGMKQGVLKVFRRKVTPVSK